MWKMPYVTNCTKMSQATDNPMLPCGIYRFDFFYISYFFINIYIYVYTGILLYLTIISYYMIYMCLFTFIYLILFVHLSLAYLILIDLDSRCCHPMGMDSPHRNLQMRSGRNEELAEFAKHRLDSRLHATQHSRRKAVQWRHQQTPGHKSMFVVIQVFLDSKNF